VTTCHGQHHLDLQHRIHLVIAAWLAGHITGEEMLSLVRPLEWLMQH
jgi:hypothetical protein